MSNRSNRKRRHSGKLAFESLEPRVVLDAQFGAALAGNLGISDAAATEAGAVSEPARSLERFTSADELQQFLIRDANQRYGDLFGREAWGWWSWLDVMIGGDPKLNPDALVEHRGDYSTTNIQVAGVDEGDLVKTDGQYLYIGVGPEVTIVDVQSAAEMRVLSRLGSEGQTSALYLSDERLTVISQSTSWFRGPMPLTDVALRYPSWGGRAEVSGNGLRRLVARDASVDQSLGDRRQLRRLADDRPDGVSGFGPLIPPASTGDRSRSSRRERRRAWQGAARTRSPRRSCRRHPAVAGFGRH